MYTSCRVRSWVYGSLLQDRYPPSYLLGQRLKRKLTIRAIIIAFTGDGHIQHFFHAVVKVVSIGVSNIISAPDVIIIISVYATCWSGSVIPTRLQLGVFSAQLRKLFTIK
jgi:hypothetical protein